jgi:hypothetical protein
MHEERRAGLRARPSLRLPIGQATRSGVGMQPAPWEGAFLIHGESSGAHRDIFWQFGSIDCVFGEDAGAQFDGYEWYFPYECNGFDDDLDGTVDEGADDTDHDGVSDCLERDHP